MKLELTGILKEAFPPPQPATATEANSKPTYQVVARLGNLDGEPYVYINVPVEMIGDAQVGDEFTLYLERVKK